MHKQNRTSVNIDGWFKQVRENWCELNFKEGIPEGSAVDFQQNYDQIDAIQEARSARVAANAGLDDPRAITFIPSVIVKYDKFWKNMVALS